MHWLNPSGVAQLSEIWETQKNKLREHAGLSTLPNAETSDLPVTPSLLVPCRGFAGLPHRSITIGKSISEEMLAWTAAA